MTQKVDVENVPPGSKVELYISPTCPYCRAAMRHYDERGTPYEIHDAQNDRRARQKMFSYTGDDPTVPAIVIDGSYVQSGWGTPPSG